MIRRGTCRRPPAGWWCSQPVGHPYACPTRPSFWKAVWLWLKGYPL